MKTVIPPRDRDFMETLRSMNRATVHQLCGQLNVTATAIRQRLNRLVVTGLVSRITEKSVRGRPSHSYCVTEVGQRSLGDNYSELARILWQQIVAIDDRAIRERLFGQIRDALADRYGRGVSLRGSLNTRVDQLRGLLHDEGFSVESDSSGSLPILRENNCPYLDLAKNDSQICELEQAVFEQVLGTEVRLTQRCVDGHNCCEFHVGPGD
jgi:predicted ArsR family transcriptional regulator